MGTVYFKDIQCSNSCVFCPEKIINIGKIHDRKSDKEILDETLNIIRSGDNSIFVTGNEALAYPKIVEYLIWVRKKFDIIILMDPCLMLEDPVFTKKIFDIPVDEIIFPLYGSCPETHDACTGSPGSFFRISKAIDNISNLMTDRTTVSVTSVLLQQNSNDFRNVLNFLRSKGLKLTSVSIPCIHPLTEERFQSFMPNPDSLRKSIMDISNFAENQISVRGVPPCIFSTEELRHLTRIFFINSDKGFSSTNLRASDTEKSYSRFISTFYVDRCSLCGIKDSCGGMGFHLAKVLGDVIHPIESKDILKGKVRFLKNHYYYQNISSAEICDGKNYFH